MKWLTEHLYIPVYAFCYQTWMRYLHRHHRHYLTICFPGNDKQYWCQWCGWRLTIRNWKGPRREH